MADTVVIAHPDNPERTFRTLRSSFTTKYQSRGFVEVGDLKRDQLEVAAAAAGVTRTRGSTKAAVAEALVEAVDYPPPMPSLPDDRPKEG
ncbi:MAG TPA: hypothetical protein VGB14_00365 [Acidimicrobiales bacterium]|jgi:hypothetical protein